jgi:hypothetical protein
VSNDITGITSHTYYPGEVVYQVAGFTGENAALQDATATATVALTPTSPNIDLIYITGTFEIGETIKGVDSSIECVVNQDNGTTDTLVMTNNEDKTVAGDNDEIEAESDKLDVFNFTETDPFSEGNY